MSEPIKLVSMERADAEANAPLRADVHPAEVENYKAGGWRVAEAPQEQSASDLAPAAGELEVNVSTSALRRRAPRRPRTDS
jgi:hypothetical protein